MKKSFPLEDPRHAPPRVVAAIKNDVRKYMKWERRKTLPEGVDFWDFDCRVGRDPETAEVAHEKKLIGAIDTASKEQWSAIYIEILAKPGHRKRKSGGENDRSES